MKKLLKNIVIVVLLILLVVVISVNFYIQSINNLILFEELEKVEKSNEFLKELNILEPIPFYVNLKDIFYRADEIIHLSNILIVVIIIILTILLYRKRRKREK